MTVSKLDHLDEAHENELSLSVLEAVQAVIKFQLDGTVITANESFLKTLGYSLDEIMSKQLKSLCSSEFVESDAFKTILESVSRSEIHFVTKSGRTAYFCGYLVKSQDKSQVTFVGIDISDIKTELQVRTDIMNQTSIVSEANLRGDILSINEKYIQVSKYSKDELIGKPHNITRHPDMPKEVFKEMWATIGKGNLFRGVVKNRAKDGNSSRLGRDRLGNRRGKRSQCISFVVGPAKCALPISDIQEILKVEKLGESALRGGYCVGTIDLRGTTVPVIDFPALLNYREVDKTDRATQGDRRIVVMKLNKELFGLLVDSIDSIISYFPDELILFPLVDQSRVEMFVGCISKDGTEDILLLNHDKILTNNEILQITHGHSKLYQANSSGSTKDKAAAGSRQTFITFKVDAAYAVAINEVKEIIDYPRNLLHPPGLPKHIKGVLNLRGDLVTIVDTRGIYSASSSDENHSHKKVLIFNKNGAHLGLVVDEVESIISFSENEKMKIPPILYKASKGTITDDISEAVQVIDSHGNKQSLLILNIDSIVKRCTEALSA